MTKGVYNMKVKDIQSTILLVNKKEKQQKITNKYTILTQSPDILSKHIGNERESLYIPTWCSRFSGAWNSSLDQHLI